MKKSLKELIENAEETIKGAYEKGYSDGRAARDSEIVRCKDCKYHDDIDAYGTVYCPNVIGGWVSERFFCAGGERRDDDLREQIIMANGRIRALEYDFNMPTADVVEVVRCKDCKHSIEDKLFGGLWCQHPTEKHCERNANFYCGSGERREDG